MKGRFKVTVGVDNVVDKSGEVARRERILKDIIKILCIVWKILMAFLTNDNSQFKLFKLVFMRSLFSPNRSAD